MKRAATPLSAQAVSGAEVVKVEATDPREIAMSMLPDYGWDQGQFSCLDSLWLKGEQLEPVGVQRVLRCIRDPAVAAWLEDGLGRFGLPHQPRYADRVGPGLHPRLVRFALRRLVALPVQQLVLNF